MPEDRKGFVLRLPPDKWLSFKKFLLDNGTTAQEWFESQVDAALAAQKKGNKK